MCILKEYLIYYFALSDSSAVSLQCESYENGQTGRTEYAIDIN